MFDPLNGGVLLDRPRARGEGVAELCPGGLCSSVFFLALPVNRVLKPVSSNFCLASAIVTFGSCPAVGLGMLECRVA